MTPYDLSKLYDSMDPMTPIPVTVQANDYRYDGWLVMVGYKKSGACRCAVEDEHGRLFVHNPQQIRKRDNG